MKRFFLLVGAIAAIFLLSGCITATIGGALENCLGWLFGNGAKADQNTIREKFSAYCEIGAEKWLDFQEKTKGENTGYDNVTLYNESVFELSECKFFAALLIFNRRTNSSYSEVSAADIETFIAQFYTIEKHTYTFYVPVEDSEDGEMLAKSGLIIVFKRNAELEFTDEENQTLEFYEAMIKEFTV